VYDTALQMAGAPMYQFRGATVAMKALRAVVDALPFALFRGNTAKPSVISANALGLFHI
jgi:hypothetical protein